MLEVSGTGALIDIDRIPKPDMFSMTDWLKAFLSYGFVLSVAKVHTGSVIALFQEKKIAAGVIGEVTRAQQMVLSYQGKQDMLFDFEKESVTGITAGLDGPGFSFG
jgi:uncharacterized protein